MYTPPTPTRQDSTVSSRRRRRCVLGLIPIFDNKFNLCSTFSCVCGWLCGQTRRKSSRERDEGSDGDSSVCEELIEEPIKEEKTEKEQTANEDRFV